MKRVNLLGAEAPRLVELGLVGVGLTDWTVPFVFQLESLSLRLIKEACAPTTAELLDVLRACSDLHSLELWNLFLAVDAASVTPSVPLIRLPKLRRFEVGQINQKLPRTSSPLCMLQGAHTSP